MRWRGSTLLSDAAYWFHRRASYTSMIKSEILGEKKCPLISSEVFGSS